MLKEFGVSNRNGYSFRPAPKMTEATSFEVAFLVSAIPPSGSHREWGTDDGGGVCAGCLAVCSPNVSSVSSEWGTFCAGDGEFNGPNGIAVASDGSVYVSDSNNHRVQKFSPAP
jgi:DNA-binding beta-propeller fold protein YncE